MYGYANDFLNKFYFYILFLGVNLTFFPIHRIGIIGIPRRYFAYGEVYLNLNIVTFLGTLLTIFSWLILFVLIFDSYIITINSWRYERYGDAIYGVNLPYHTYLERWFYSFIRFIHNMMMTLFFRRRMFSDKDTTNRESEFPKLFSFLSFIGIFKTHMFTDPKIHAWEMQMKNNIIDEMER